jgi:hypothetical protein
MNMQEFISWITEDQYLHIMSLSDHNLRAFIETETVEELPKLQARLRGVFAHRIYEDFYKYSSLRYYFTIQFNER